MAFSFPFTAIAINHEIIVPAHFPSRHLSFTLPPLPFMQLSPPKIKNSKSILIPSLPRSLLPAAKFLVSTNLVQIFSLHGSSRPSLLIQTLIFLDQDSLFQTKIPSDFAPTLYLPVPSPLLLYPSSTLVYSRFLISFSPSSTFTHYHLTAQMQACSR